MRHFIEYEFVIAIKEKSVGNDSIGDMWLETKAFRKNVPISLIMDWAKDCSGKLIITIDESSADTSTF